MKSFRRRGGPSRRRVLIIVQNLPVPFDRRVWLEACALRDAGFQVSVVCPKAPGDPSFQELEGIRIRKYEPPPPTSGALSYAWEFAYCWVRTLVLVIRAATREGFDVIQACNPPDTFWALAASCSSPSGSASSSTSTTSARRSTSRASQTDREWLTVP